MAFSRRRFLQAGAILATGATSAWRSARAAPRRLVVATWPNYHSEENLLNFRQKTGIELDMRVFGSNEEMMSHLLADGGAFDVVVATNYAINAYGRMSLLRPLRLEHLPNVDMTTQVSRFVEVILAEERLYGIPKNWGTTGFVYDRRHFAEPLQSWRQFWEQAQTRASKQTVVHDYQLTAIGNALKYFGYSFNSLKPTELKDAERLLLQTKPHLKAISSLGYDEMKAGAWLAMAWSGDGTLLRRDNPHIEYVIGKEGGEIWADYFAITRKCHDVPAAEAFIDFLLTPENNAREVQAHGFPPIDQRVLPLLPNAVRSNPTVFPADAQTRHLEFGARETLTDPLRAAILTRFKRA
jgi:spermidine/putrescine transport system substrate-binding protein